MCNSYSSYKQRVSFRLVHLEYQGHFVKHLSFLRPVLLPMPCIKADPPHSSLFEKIHWRYISQNARNHISRSLSPASQTLFWNFLISPIIHAYMYIIFVQSVSLLVFVARFWHLEFPEWAPLIKSLMIKIIYPYYKSHKMSDAITW